MLNTSFRPQCVKLSVSKFTIHRWPGMSANGEMANNKLWIQYKKAHQYINGLAQNCGN